MSDSSRASIDNRASRLDGRRLNPVSLRSRSFGGTRRVAEEMQVTSVSQLTHTVLYILKGEFVNEDEANMNMIRVSCDGISRNKIPVIYSPSSILSCNIRSRVVV